MNISVNTKQTSKFEQEDILLKLESELSTMYNLNKSLVSKEKRIHKLNQSLMKQLNEYANQMNYLNRSYWVRLGDFLKFI